MEGVGAQHGFPLVRLLPGVHRCLLRVETPERPEGWTAAATTHRDDRGGLDPEMAFRIASVTKMMRSNTAVVGGGSPR